MKMKSLLQGQSWQTDFFVLALRDKNMQVRFCLKMVLKFRDLRNFAVTNSFYEIHAVHHLWSSLKTCRLCFWKKEFEYTYCKAIF